MRRTKLAIAAGALVAAACSSNPRVEAGGDVAAVVPADASMLPTGTTLDVRLNQTLGVASSSDGQEFSATVTEPVVAQNGATVVPAGARVTGHVTGIHKSSIPGEASVIRLDFDNLTFRERTYPFDASIVSMQMPGSGNAAKRKRAAVTGAVAGGALGGILSGGELSKLIEGGLLGAAAGTAIALGQEQAHAEIPAGSVMTVRATHDVMLR